MIVILVEIRRMTRLVGPYRLLNVCNTLRLEGSIVISVEGLVRRRAAHHHGVLVLVGKPQSNWIFDGNQREMVCKRVQGIEPYAKESGI